jgi:hypothetical protein
MRFGIGVRASLKRLKYFFGRCAAVVGIFYKNLKLQTPSTQKTAFARFSKVVVY